MTKPLAGLCVFLLLMAASGMAQAQQGADGAAVAVESDGASRRGLPAVA